jgi:hypothetical protein
MGNRTSETIFTLLTAFGGLIFLSVQLLPFVNPSRLQGCKGVQVFFVFFAFFSIRATSKSKIHNANKQWT